MNLQHRHDAALPAIGPGRGAARVSALSAPLWAALAAVLICTASTTAPPQHVAHPALQALPARMAWAWERNEDLRWLPHDAGVAYVATSVWLEGDTVSRRARANGLALNLATVRVPVVHVDASTRLAPKLNAAQRDAIVEELLRAATQSDARVVQLDFEARLSQRAFLADVVRSARRALPADVALSMTALASWCAGDGWMRGLPADEIVPMVFRMSRDSVALRSALMERGGFGAAPCRTAIGTAIDEPLTGLSVPRRYVFSAKPWTAAAWQSHPFF